MAFGKRVQVAGAGSSPAQTRPEQSRAELILLT